MDMSMTMAMSTTATASAMSMPTSTSTSSSTMMGAQSMAMTFFVSTSTPLWSESFSPRNTGEYAGICIFLIALGAMSRLLLALRINFFTILTAIRQKQFEGLVESRMAEEKVAAARPWRVDEAVMTAVLDVVVAGVGYLLMLAVMTLNVGYFLSVLGGVFLGGLACGRFTGGAGTH